MPFVAARMMSKRDPENTGPKRKALSPGAGGGRGRSPAPPAYQAPQQGASDDAGAPRAAQGESEIRSSMRSVAAPRRDGGRQPLETRATVNTVQPFSAKRRARREHQSVPAASRVPIERPEQRRAPASTRNTSRQLQMQMRSSSTTFTNSSVSNSSGLTSRRGPSVSTTANGSAPPSRAGSGSGGRPVRVPPLRLPKTGAASPKRAAVPRTRVASRSVPQPPRRVMANSSQTTSGALEPPAQPSEPRTVDAWTAPITPRLPIPASEPRQGTTDAGTGPCGATPRIPDPGSVPPTPRDFATALRRLQEQRQETEALRRKAAEAERIRAQADQERRAALQDRERLAECEAALLKREAEVEDLVAAERRAVERRAAEEKEEWIAEMKREATRQLESVKAQLEDRVQRRQPEAQPAASDFSDSDGCGKTAFFARLDGASKLAVLRLTGEDLPAAFTGAASNEGKTGFFARLPGVVKAEALQRWRDGRRSTRASASPADGSGAPHRPAPAATAGVSSRVAAVLSSDRQQQMEELDEELEDLLRQAGCAA